MSKVAYLEDSLLEAARAAFVGKRLRVGGQRKPRLCVAIEEGDADGLDVTYGLDFLFENGERKFCGVWDAIRIAE